jgi:hypothetical protein
VTHVLKDSHNLEPGFEVAGCQWPKADHILEMAGKNKFELPKVKKNGRRNSIDIFRSFAYHNSYILDHLVD